VRTSFEHLTAIVLSSVIAACAATPAPQQRAKPAPRAQPGSADRQLTAALERIALPTGGQVGIALRVLGGGRTYTLRGSETFPMASVYKFPIALAVLAKVDRGELALGATLTLKAEDLSVYHSPIAEDFQGTERKLTIAELLSALIVQSDNTASDVLMAAAGGAARVNAHVETLGVEGIRIDRSEREMAADVLREARPGSVTALTRDALNRLDESLTPAENQRAWQAYARDPRDRATPVAMAALLSDFHDGKTLKPESTAHLRRLMEAAPPRMGRHFPPGAVVAHKTGTGLGTFNDVGIVTLPDGRHAVLVVFVKGAANQSAESGSKLVADLGRAIYDAALSAP
jgi:beta-lactamase class A